MYEETRTETVGEDGMVHLALPELEPGHPIKITIEDARLNDGWASAQPRSPDSEGRYRQAGRLKGLVTTSLDFDDPLLEMEPYS